MSKKEYFAYGSNLNFEQMAYRCPEATVVGTAKLDGYELAFRRGYLTILPKEGASVEGLIWSVTDHDESQLDCYEGYPTFYDKETMTVTDADGTPHEIMVYTMNAPYRDQLLPVSSRYNAVVMQGCLDAGISPQQFYDADEKYRKGDIRKLRPRRGNSGIHHTLRLVLQLPNGSVLGSFGSSVCFGLAGERPFLPAERAGAGF